MNRWTRSLTAKLALLTGAWTTIGLTIVWFGVSQLVSAATDNSFNARLTSLVDALVAATVLENGLPVLTRPISEPRFDQLLSGVYYKIQGPDGRSITSRSLWDETLPEGRFGHSTVLLNDLPGPLGQHLRLAERDIVPLGSGGTVHVLVAMSRDATMAELDRTRRKMGIGFGVLGAGLVIAIVLQVSIGLWPLRRLRSQVAAVRAGAQEDVFADIPSEVQPLVSEIVALVHQNRATVERARNHVGNLAHALRTRLSVMRNALDSQDTDVLRQELNEADRLVQHHLARARAAALSGVSASDVSVWEAAESIAGALRRLFSDRGLTISVTGDSEANARCEHEDLTEMLGNLMENACKWSGSKVTVDVRQSGGLVTASVSDDGPGLPEGRAAAVASAGGSADAAVARGVRLDESIPGTGLGLAIVADLAVLYGGHLDLVSPGPDGGLAASLTLPAASGQRAFRSAPKVPSGAIGPI